MRAFLLLLLVFGFGLTLSAQDKQYTKASDSDPEAIMLLKTIRDRYDAYKTIEADFQLDINLPGMGAESQKGKIKRQGDKVRFRLGDQEGIVNADAAYIIQHANKEVLINDLPSGEEAGGMLTPQTLFNFYEGDNFVVALQNKETFEGRLLQAVELKPVDRDNSDFTKLRLLVDAKNKEIVTIKAFARDGSNYTFRLANLKGDVALSAGTFAFDKADFPGYHVEDLRF